MRTCAVERVLPSWPSIGDFRTDLARRRTSKKALKFRYSGFDCAGLLTRETDESDNCRRRQHVESKPRRTTFRNTLWPLDFLGRIHLEAGERYGRSAWRPA